jgi:hypothetical protein
MSTDEQPVTIELRLSRARWTKLSALADAEGLTISEVLWRFIDACQPGGGGWEAPDVKARRREREERDDG